MRAVELRELANRLRPEREDAESRQDARQHPEAVSSTPVPQR
jgi:hypothetical protein